VKYKPLEISNMNQWTPISCSFYRIFTRYPQHREPQYNFARVPACSRNPEDTLIDFKANAAGNELPKRSLLCRPEAGSKGGQRRPRLNFGGEGEGRVCLFFFQHCEVTLSTPTPRTYKRISDCCNIPRQIPRNSHTTFS